MVKDPLKVQNRTLGFNIAEDKKFIDMASDSTLQLTLRNYHLSSSDIYNIKRRYTKMSSEKAIKQSSLFQLHVCLMLDFLHRLQTKQHSNSFNRGADGRIWLPSIKSDIKDVNVKQCHSSYYIFLF